MRFNGTTVPTNRDDTYTTKETNRDIQTGRAVYADKDKYENDEAYKANIDKYVAEGFHLIFGTPDQASEGGSSGGSGSDVGYECTDTITTLTEESVTTEDDGGFAIADLSYSQLIDADTIRVTFNGTEYICSNVTEEDGGLYGAIDGWSTYPFVLESHSTPLGINTSLSTETAGTYSVKIETVQESIETSDCFKKAVLSTSALFIDTTKGFTYNDVANAFKAGKVVYLTSPLLGVRLVVYAGIDSENDEYFIHILRFTSSTSWISLSSYHASSPTERMVTVK